MKLDIYKIYIQSFEVTGTAFISRFILKFKMFIYINAHIDICSGIRLTNKLQFNRQMEALGLNYTHNKNEKKSTNLQDFVKYDLPVQCLWYKFSLNLLHIQQLTSFFCTCDRIVTNQKKV